MAQLGEAGDAEDACQDAFFECWTRIDECREPAKFAGWLLRAVRNRAHNYREYLDLRAGASLEDTQVATPLPSADVIVERHELGAALWAALLRLDPIDREVVLLHDVDGLRHSDIGVMLEMSELMSRRRLSDTRKRLRRILRGPHEPDSV